MDNWTEIEKRYTEAEIPIFRQHKTRGFEARWIIDRTVSLKGLRGIIGSLTPEVILLTFAWVCRQGLGYRHPYYLALKQALV